MKCLKLKRYVQEPNHCAIAAMASITNLYNTDVDYNVAKLITYHVMHLRKKKKPTDFPGMTVGNMGVVLNELGFNKVKIYSCEMDYLDWEYNEMDKSDIRRNLRKKMKQRAYNAKDDCESLIEFLSPYRDNTLEIGFDYKNVITNHIDSGVPVVITFNWTMLFKASKDENGNYENHAVCACGYDKDGVIVIDSHHYKYKKKYNKGNYGISWYNLMSVMGSQGDIVIPCDYTGLKKYELV